VNQRVDPAGKRALFDPMHGGPGERAIRPTNPGGRSGKRSLFTVGDRRPGTVVTRCEDCGASARINLLDYAVRHLPFWLWIPGKRYSRLLRCPACERLTWQHVSFLS
jgi:hypothetical protein